YGIETIDLKQTSVTALPTFAFSEVSGESVKGLSTLKEVVLPTALTLIDSYAFSGCENLVKLNLQELDLLTTISSEGLFGTAMTELHLGKGLKTIGTAAFSNNQKLTTVTIAAENPNLEAVDNAIYSKSSNALIFYPFACPQKKLVVKAGTKSINEEVFRLQKYIEEVVLPDGFEKLDIHAFPECANLRKINLPESMTTLGEGCLGQTGIETIVIPAGITLLDAGIFQGCKNLKSVTVNGAVTAIQMRAFSDCASLEEIVFANLSALATLDMYVFNNCPKLQSLDLSTSQLTELPYKSFTNGASLATVKLPATIQSMADYVFDGCESLNLAAFPANLKTIGDFAFRNCKALTRIEIGVNIEEIGSGAFSNCIGVTDLIVEENNYFIKSDEGFLINSDGNRLIFAPANSAKGVLSVMDGIDTIDDYAFSGNQNLTKVILPSDVLKIGEAAFADCSKLESLDLSRCSKLNTFGKEVFKNCIQLKEIKWPADKEAASLTFNQGVFQNCTALTEVRLPKQTQTVYTSLFEGCVNLQKADLTNATNLKSLNNMFVDCESLTTVLLPQNGVLSSFGASAFKGCASLKSIVIPATVKAAGGVTGRMFENAGIESVIATEGHPAYKTIDGVLYSTDGKSLYVYPRGKQGDVVIPDHVEAIYGNAFYGVDNITKVTLSANMKPFGYNCVKGSFVKMLNLKEIAVPENALNYSVENGVLYSKDFKTLCLYPAAKSGPFELNQAVENLESEAIADNPYLTEVVVNAPLLKFLNYAFAYLPNLTSLDLPETVALMTYAVKECPQLEKAIVRATTPPTATKSTFLNCHPDLQVFVPKAALSAYKAHNNWSKFSLNAIEDIPDALDEVTDGHDSTVKVTVANKRVTVLSTEQIAWTEVYATTGAMLAKTAQSEIELNGVAREIVILVVRMRNGDTHVQKVYVD
ncbi:MAG: leucine-rich repeat protein, partial [Bacteroidales bacterium]